MYKEAEQLAGPVYSRKESYKYEATRWGSNPGSVFLGESRARIQVPRVRSAKKEIPLRSYHALQSSRLVQEYVLARLLGVLSCRRYSECAELVREVFGVSASSLPRRFIEVTKKKLKAFQPASWRIRRNLKQLAEIIHTLKGLGHEISRKVVEKLEVGHRIYDQQLELYKESNR